MKTKIKIISVLIFFTSCGDIDLKFPQPTYLENIEKIAVVFNFLAVLELLQLKTIRLTVGEGFNNFWIEQI